MASFSIKVDAHKRNTIYKNVADNKSSVRIAAIQHNRCSKHPGIITKSSIFGYRDCKICLQEAGMSKKIKNNKKRKLRSESPEESSDDESCDGGAVFVNENKEPIRREELPPTIKKEEKKKVAVLPDDDANFEACTEIMLDADAMLSAEDRKLRRRCEKFGDKVVSYHRKAIKVRLDGDVKESTFMFRILKDYLNRKPRRGIGYSESMYNSSPWLWHRSRLRRLRDILEAQEYRMRRERWEVGKKKEEAIKFLKKEKKRIGQRFPELLKLQVNENKFKDGFDTYRKEDVFVIPGKPHDRSIPFNERNDKDFQVLRAALHVWNFTLGSLKYRSPREIDSAPLYYRYIDNYMWDICQDRRAWGSDTPTETVGEVRERVHKRTMAYSRQLSQKKNIELAKLQEKCRAFGNGWAADRGWPMINL